MHCFILSDHVPFVTFLAFPGPLTCHVSVSNLEVNLLTFSRDSVARCIPGHSGGISNRGKKIGFGAN